MAPFLMTLNDPDCRNCFRLYYLFEANYFRKYATNLRLIFRIGSLMSVDDRCEIGLRSLKGSRTATNFCFFSIHAIILVTVTNV